MTEHIELVERLRDWAEVEGYGTAKATLVEAADAIEELVKQQEPRLIKKEELNEMANNNIEIVVYEEIKGKSELYGAIAGDNVSETLPSLSVHEIKGHLNDLAFYGKTWRCWAGRPTDDQRLAVKWDD